METKPSAAAPSLLRNITFLVLMTIGAIVVHGYHPAVEDAEIYLPGIKKILDPSLYPKNAEFFSSHASRTFFPNLIAASVRFTHIRLDYALLLWHATSIFMLLLGCFQLGRLCFKRDSAGWAGAALVASLLTIPVAGTALYILDQYLNTRSLSSATILLAIVSVVESRYARAALWFLVTALIHPLMVVFGLSFAVLLVALQRNWRPLWIAALLPFSLFGPVSAAYLETLNSRSYFFVTRWRWYEWVGVVAPLLILWFYVVLGKRKNLPKLAILSRALVYFGIFYTGIALLFAVPQGMRGFALLQPMRAFHLIYVLFFVLSGGLLAQYIFKGQAWRWLALFISICAGMFYVQRDLFEASRHLELPCLSPRNDWVAAFRWVQVNTPKDAFFALDPNYMEAPGADEHGFRALAERSRMADNIKDTGAVTMFPKIAPEWQRQVQALKNWRSFGHRDFEKLRDEFGVDWVVLVRPQAVGLNCPYTNNTLAVCNLQE